MQRRSDGGYVVVWMLVVIAVVVAGASAIHFADDQAGDPAMSWLFAGASLVAAWGLWVESQRDRYAAAAFALVVAFVAGVVTGSVAFYGASPHPVAAAVALLSALTFVLCAIVIWRTQYGAERLPDLLRQRFHRSSIFELEGVQIVLVQSATEVEAGGGFAAEVFAQSCWDAERRLTIALAPELRLSLDRAGLAPATTTVTLPAGGVVRTILPIAVAKEAKGRHALAVKLTVEGSGGTRVRTRRATGLQQVGTAMTIVAALALHYVAARLRIQVRVTPSRGATELRESVPTSEVLYRPTAQELAAT